MKAKLIILTVLILTACNSSKKVLKNEDIGNKNYFRVNGVYSQLSEGNYCDLYFFNSQNNIVYFSKFKINDTINKFAKLKLQISEYGKYDVEGNTIKIQQNIEKKVRVTGRNFWQTIIFTFPLPAPTSKHEVTIIDKKIILQGEIKEDALFMSKKYLGAKKTDFKKKKLSNIEVMNSVLIYEPKFRGIIKTDNIYNNYSVQIISTI